MKISIGKEGDSTLISLEGRITFIDSPEFKATVEELCSDSATSIILDFSKVEYLDSSAIGSLISIIRSIRGVNKTVRCRKIPPKVLNMLRTIYLTDFFNIVEEEPSQTTHGNREDDKQDPIQNDCRKFIEIASDKICMIYDELKAGGAVDLFGLYSLANEINWRVHDCREAILSVLMADFGEDYIFSHGMKVGVYASIAAIQMGLSVKDITDCTVAGMIHDYGMMLLNSQSWQRTGSLSDLDWQEVMKHPDIGADELVSKGLPESIGEIIRKHHERLDGSGYPKGLSGKQIGDKDMMVALADVFDALMSPRSYRPPYEAHEAFKMTLQLSRKQIDEKVLKSFLSGITYIWHK